jgi:CysZ protein
MKNSVKAVGKSFSMFKEDKLIILLSLVPIIVGLGFYYYLGNLFYVDLLGYGNSYLESNVTNNNVGGVLSWILTGLLTIVLFFLVNWTFVLFVSIVASPFNDLISGRVERVIKGTISDSLDSERFFKKFFKTILNEAKKISLIIVLSIIAFIIGMFFPPLAFVISALLLAISFLDYSWSRKELSFGECVSNLRGSFFSYLITGSAFMALISIPIVNLLVLPYAVVYYSVLYYSKEQIENSI